MLILPSARANGPPGQEWTPRPNARWACVGPVDAELLRALEPPGVAVGGAVEQHDRCAGRDVDAGDGRRAPGQTEVRLHRALDPECLLDEIGDPSRVPAARPGARGARQRCFMAAASSRAVVSWPAAKRKVAVRTTDVTSGVVPSG
jgi:hypothetical protein